MAAITVPREPRTGAAVEQRPASSSSHVVAKPCPPDLVEIGEQVAHVGDRARAELREPAERRLRSPERHEHLAHATMRGPGSGCRPSCPLRADGALSTCASRATPRGVGIATFAVSPVSRPSRSRNGHASVARSPTLESRRAYSTSTGPGRNPPPVRRCASPFRSSARSRRAAVDLGSCVSCMTPESVTTWSLSTSCTRIRAARSIA